MYSQSGGYGQSGSSGGGGSSTIGSTASGTMPFGNGQYTGVRQPQPPPAPQPQPQRPPSSTGSSRTHSSMKNNTANNNNSSKTTLDPAVKHLLNTMGSVGPKLPQGLDIDPDLDPEEDYDFLEQLLQSGELNALVKAHNVILFCNQEMCPCVSSCCTIAQDVMEEIRPFALMIEECRELYAILTTPHIRVSGRQSGFWKVFWGFSLLLVCSFGELNGLRVLGSFV